MGLAPEQLPLPLQQIQERIHTLWSNSHSQNSRLYALRVNAYHVLFELRKIIFLSQNDINGPTGFITCYLINQSKKTNLSPTLIGKNN